ncbi:MAG: hypothetical protein H0T46_21730 [Deltaproteobacteria bacterium]|nr:hypothetical protein [Deltaproteobacteria bacterium]
MLRPLLLVLATVVLAFTSSADAAPKKKYYFELAAVTAKPEVKADVAKSATTRVEAQVKKAFAAHAQLVKLEGQPDWRTSTEPYRKFLKKKGVASAYLVTVELTDASMEVVPMEDKPSSQRIVVRIGIHMLGESIPARTMGFTGDGSATIKVEVGKKIRDADYEYAWAQAAEAAVADAMVTVFKQLAIPQKKQ